MIDTLEANRDKAVLLDINEIIKQNLIKDQPETCNLKLETDGYAVLTIHRP